MLRVLLMLGALVISQAAGETLGYVQQRFSYLNFQKGKWERVEKLPCYSYVAKENGATVDVLRATNGNLVPFKASKGLTITVCGSTAAFDEGFEAGAPMQSGGTQKR